MRVIQVTCVVFFSALLILVPQTAFAEKATFEEMEQVCQNWLAYIVHEAGGWAGESQPTIRQVDDIIRNDILLGRCYSINPVGYIVVPILKEMPPVYTFSEESDVDLSLTEGLSDLIRGVLLYRINLYVNKYGSLEATQSIDSPLLFGNKYGEEWDRLLMSNASYMSDLESGGREDMVTVGPLLSTKWGQRGSYNDNCPEGDGDTCLVGCVATATSQIMKFHNWPPIGQGSWGYDWDGDDSCDSSLTVGAGWIEADFSDSPYDWSNMPNDCDGGCTQVEAEALSELCFEVGVAYEMDYGNCSSSAWTAYGRTVLPTYFRYHSNIARLDRSGQTEISWFLAIQAEIDWDRPMLYRIQMEGGGHAIVCDGWRTTDDARWYHMNMGWYGNDNAFFRIDEIDGAVDPLDEEYMVRYIWPDTSSVFTIQPDGSGDFATIQGAIDSLGTRRAIIELADGTYTGPGNRGIDFNGKSMTVRSQSGNPQDCIIDCQEADRGFRFHSGEGPEAVVEGITIKNGYKADNGGGITCYFHSSPTIRNCILVDNDSGANGGAMSLGWYSYPTIIGCTFYNNGSALSCGAIHCNWGGHVSMYNTIISDSKNGKAMSCDGFSAPDYLRCCNFYNNPGGNFCGWLADSLGVNGNIEADPRYCDAPDNLGLCADSPCLDPAGSCDPYIGAVGEECDTCGEYACCDQGTCTIFTSSADCTASGGVWHPEWETCDPDSCPPGEGACCRNYAVCQVLTQEACSDSSGFYMGHGVLCDPLNPCLAPCCVDSTCIHYSEDDCVNVHSGEWHPEILFCSSGDCDKRACCDGEDCELLIRRECNDLGRTWHSAETACDPNPCEAQPIAACCFSGGYGWCGLRTEAQCASQGGIWHEEWPTCDDNPCWKAACCVDGSCNIRIKDDCDGDWYYDATECSPGTFCDEAACCIGGQCVITTNFDCTTLRGGEWYQDWDSCDAEPCKKAACCNDGYCVVTMESECDPGTWLEEEPYCEPNPCSAVCCIQGACYVRRQLECDSSDGIWYQDWGDCGTVNPCPAVCCYDAGTCDVVDTLTCVSLDGTRYTEGSTCDPNPCRHIVRPDGSGDYDTIQHAINAIGNNEVIALTNGVFYVETHQSEETEGINFLGKDIVVYSLGGNPSTCIVDGGASKRGFRFQSGEGNSAVLRGVTIRNGHADWGGGIACSNASPHIDDCVFLNNWAYNGAGIGCGSSSSPSITGCIFSENTATFDGGGIYSNESSHPTFSGCVFTSNTATNGGAICCGPTNWPGIEGYSGSTFYGNVAFASGAGIFCYANSSVWLERALIAFSTMGGAVGCEDPQSAPSFTCSNIYGNTGGDWTGCISNQLGGTNISEDPLFCDPPTDLRIEMISPCLGFNSPCGELIGALGGGCGFSSGSSDLTNGVLITHHPNGLEYATGQDWCQIYSDDHSIGSCAVQNTRINATGSTSSVWYILAAWNEDREWCETEIGFSNYLEDIYLIEDHGPCFPGNGVVTATAGWPGPGEGVNLITTDTPWSGNFVPVYWFAGYNSEADVGTIQLDGHPTTGFAGMATCDFAPQRVAAAHLGGMGIQSSGHPVCPDPPQTPSVCCYGDVTCAIMTPNACANAGGTSYSDLYSCDPNPCPAVCCVGGICTVVSQIDCAAAGGAWDSGLSICDPNPCSAACCILGGYCAVLSENQCSEATGIWHADWPTCDPNFCPGVCCDEEACSLVSEDTCVSAGGVWHVDWETCNPNPCLTPLDWADHDIGNFLITMTDHGSLGFMSEPDGEGSGFVYPEDGENHLYIGGLWVGESQSYVANRDYSTDPTQEWVVATDPDGHILVEESGSSHQDIFASYTDSGATEPRGLLVEQESWAYAVNDAVVNHVIIRYTIGNQSASALNDLYVGIFLDLDIGGSAYEDEGSAESERNLVYMNDASDIHVGLRLLQNEEGEPEVSNLSLIQNSVYVWPQSAYVLEADKYDFLAAADSLHVLSETPFPHDYGIVASAGPIDLGAGEDTLIAFAIVGGENLYDLRMSSDAAELLFRTGYSDIPVVAEEPVNITRLLPCAPNPFTRRTLVRFNLSDPAQVNLSVFDATGRRVRMLVKVLYPAGRHSVEWDGRDQAGRLSPDGIYFLNLIAGQSKDNRRVVLLR